MKFDASTGVVLEVNEDTDDPGCLERIYRVDVDTLRQSMPDFEDREEIDILDVGYWYTTDRGSTGYEPHVQEHIDWSTGKREVPY